MEEFRACNGDVNKVKEWMKTNDIHIDDDHALRYSASRGYLEATRELIKAGANIHTCDDQALYWSTLNGHLEVVRELIKAGVNVHAHNNVSLRWNALNGHLEVVQELIKAGANIHVDDNYALRCSAINEYLEVTRELLKHYKYIQITKFSDIIKSRCEYRMKHYINIISIMIYLPCELYDEIAQFI